MAYKQKCSPFKAMGDEKKVTTSSRDPKGLLTVTTKTSSSGSGKEKASKEDWNKFLNSPEGKAYTFKKEAKKSLTQVPVKGAITVDTSTDIRDVQGVPGIEKEKPRGGSSMKGRGRLKYNIKKAFTKKNKGGGGGFCPECIKKFSSKR